MSGIFFNPGTHHLVAALQLRHAHARRGTKLPPGEGHRRGVRAARATPPRGERSRERRRRRPRRAAERKGARVVSPRGATPWWRNAVIVASAGPDADALLGDALASNPSATGAPVGTTCAYFAIDGPPRFRAYPVPQRRRRRLITTAAFGRRCRRRTRPRGNLWRPCR